jgi:hypothetical protein
LVELLLEVRSIWESTVLLQQNTAYIWKISCGHWKPMLLAQSNSGLNHMVQRTDVLNWKINLHSDLINNFNSTLTL